MPEGDTLHRTAAVLTKALVGQVLVAVRGRLSPRDQADLVGQQVTRVSAHGKNLLVAFERGRALHTHLQMHGSWHVYRPGERWRRPAHDMRVVLDVGDISAVCFGAPTVRLLSSDRPENDPRLSELGPDVVADAFDPDLALARMRALSEAPIGVAVMDQTGVSGIGNIYKSETLFLTAANPFAKVASFSDSQLSAIVQRARELMRVNTRPEAGVRTTRGGDGSRYWVYRRARLPCWSCSTPVQMRRQGEMHRSTYYCARCQNVHELDPAR